MAASPLKIVTVAGTDLTSVHGHHPINRHYNLNHLHQLHHHVTFNLAPRPASPTPPSGFSDTTDTSSQPVPPATAAGGSLPAPAVPAARRKMSVMHTEPLMVVQETTQANLCLTPGKTSRVLTTLQSILSSAGVLAGTAIQKHRLSLSQVLRRTHRVQRPP